MIYEDLLPWESLVMLPRSTEQGLEVLAIKTPCARWALPSDSVKNEMASASPRLNLELAARQAAIDHLGVYPSEIISLGSVLSTTNDQLRFAAVFIVRDVRRTPESERILASRLESQAVSWRPFRQLVAGPQPQAIRSIASIIGYRL